MNKRGTSPVQQEDHLMDRRMFEGYPDGSPQMYIPDLLAGDEASVIGPEDLGETGCELRARSRTRTLALVPSSTMSPVTFLACWVIQAAWG
jgi:hypothetical protein